MSIQTKAEVPMKSAQLWESISLQQQQQQSTFQANTVQEILAHLKNKFRSTPSEQASLPPSVTIMGELPNQTSSNISTLESEISSLKEMINHMEQPQ